MNKILLVTVFTTASLSACAQKQVTKADAGINVKEVTRIETVLASDAMKGRKTYSPEIDKAADFIAAEFKAAGLKPAGKGDSFLQPFELLNVKQTAISAELNGEKLDETSVLVLTSETGLDLSEKSGYTLERIPKGASFFTKAMAFNSSGKNSVVLVDTSFRKDLPRLSRLRRGMFRSPGTTVFILTAGDVAQWKVKVSNQVETAKLANVVGILPGRSRKNEYVIFSGHYDHLGTKKTDGTDSIFNGANDDAAGTTAVIMLAKYYAKLAGNERTIVFAAFTAEEIGGFGSQYFSKQFDPEQVMAMFNIEMIGTDSKWGINSAYITGYEKTNMGEILQKNLAGTEFQFYPDPYTDQQLFYRSDNATLARLGVPAHTISTSKMDAEPNYHKVSDHVETLDMENMTRIIRSIALSARSIVEGKDTPSRVDTSQLR
ncbi:MAG: M20/M25/M40 family metallo-hydrolase [Chitinophagaceae bacterium]|nr:MAG: M20/M25/M40 family metallo-hydrolase [Chitinophagaceae bacterium]